MLFKKDKYIIALEIEDSHVKFAVSAYRNNSTSIVEFDEKEFGSDDSREVKKILKDLFAKFRRFNPNVVLVIPRRYFTVRNMKIPSFEEIEIKNILELQATRQIPYSKEEIVTDFKVIEQFPDGFSSVFFSIVHQDVVKKRLELLYELGIDIDVVSISTDGLWAWDLLQERKDAKVPFALLDIDNLNAEVIMVGENTFEFSRSFSYKPDNMGKFVDEIKLTFSTYASEKDAKIGNLIITGVGEELEEIQKTLEKELNIDVRKISQSENIILSSGASKKSGILNEKSFVSLFGCLFNPGVLSLNFLPKNIIMNRQFSILKRNAVLFASLFVISLLVVSSLIYIKIKEKRNFLNQIENNIKLLEPEVSKLNKISNNINLIRNQLKLKGSSIDIIREVYKVTPPGIYLTSFNYEEGKLAVLKGNASTLSEVLKLVSKLESSDYFENVKLKYVTNRLVKGRELTDFEISAPLTSVAQAE